MLPERRGDFVADVTFDEVKVGGGIFIMQSDETDLD